MTLGDAEVGSTVVVTKIEGDSAYKRRIMDMGDHKRKRALYQKGRASWRPGRDHGSRIRIIRQEE